MNSDAIKELLLKGRGTTIDYAKCAGRLSSGLFKTVCAFSNRDGGHLILGASNDGRPLGVKAGAVSKIQARFAGALANPKIVNPPLFLKLEEAEIDGQKLLHAYVPAGSGMRFCRGRFYYRHEDVDLDVDFSAAFLARISSRQLMEPFDRKIIPGLALGDLRLDLVERARSMALALAETARRTGRKVCRSCPGLNWEGLGPMELLRSAGLYGKDFRTGQEGFNSGALLLFGRGEAIAARAPGYEIEAICRGGEGAGSEERLVVGTNLLEAYDQLTGFVSRHAPDKIALEGGRKVSLRSGIARELVSNLLLHRDYSSGFLSRLVIEDGRMRSENFSRLIRPPGPISLDKFRAQAKNPLLSWFFLQIGLAENLGVGLRNLYKYTKIYSGSEPRLVEGHIFKAIIPLPEAKAKGRGLPFASVA
ncbi:MAG: putative DNA binding domain-containing protein [Deltaproteobacteria bacterium]|jgi:ATP-dependent DNA helicase RecG|nr:putative DNA binding domain-containing protein [Deltaproteobacteria bacterium]